MRQPLRPGDQFLANGGETAWTVRSALPGRLRLVSSSLRDNAAAGARLQLLASHHPEVARLRVNLWAGSLLLEHISLKPWRRRSVQTLLDQLTADPAVAAVAPLTAAPSTPAPRGPLLRLTLAGLLLLAQSSLSPTWGLPIAALLLPPLLIPLLRSIRQEWKHGELPRESLDLAWYATLLLRGELGSVATELAVDNGSQMLQGPIHRAGSYSQALSEQLQRWMEQVRFPLEDPHTQPKRIAQLCRGDRLRLGQGDVVPLEGFVVGGEAMVSKRLLDGETALIGVRPFQPLPVGVQVVQGALVFKLSQELAEQPLYDQLLHLSPQDHPPWGIERARRLHRQLLPVLLGSGLFALLLGRLHQAAALMQFDPINDWQLSASVAYRGASTICNGWGVRLRQGAVLDRLCQCRTLVIAEGAICYGVQRELLDVVSLHGDYDSNVLIEIVAGFRRFLQPDSIALFPLQMLLQQRDLEPRPVQEPQPAGPFGLRGRIQGQRVWLGGGALLNSLRIPRPEAMPQQRGLHWMFVVIERQVVGGLLFRDQLDRDVSRSLRRLRHHGWRLHLVSTWHGDMLDSLARQLRLPPGSVHSSMDLKQRMQLIRDFDRSDGPVAFLGSALMDSGAFAEADIALAVTDGSLSLPAEMADIVLPSRRLDRLLDCVNLSATIGANNRQNFYLTLVPHSAALLLGLVVLLDPLIAVLLADLPMLVVEINNLRTYNALREHHRIGWKAERKRSTRRRSGALAAAARPA